MKLELKHLAAYLPYDLYFIDKDGIRDNMKSISTEINLINMGWGKGLELNELKPILRPMIDLRNDRESIIELKLFVKADLDFTISGPPGGTYDEVQYLLSKHYDVFGLLEKRLAIDINTLNK